MAEGVSFLLLMGVAMPLKYLADIPLAVTWTGWIHGVLFISFLLALLLAWAGGSLSVGTSALALIASLLPFGPFLIDRKLSKSTPGGRSRGLTARPLRPEARAVMPAAPADVKAPPADAIARPSGLVSKVLQEGSGTDRPRAADTVTVHYSGWTTDGKLFDSSVERGKSISFALDQVIAGWTEGLQLMVTGEKRRFWIPGHLAYGTNPPPGAPAGMLVFDVELLDIL